MNFLYTLLYFLALVFFLPKEYFKRPKELRKRWLKEKLGFLEKLDFNSNNKEYLWIHAVSVGEVMALKELIRALSPQYKILLSTITDTGRKVALEHFKDLEVKVIYLPFDLPFCIKRVWKTFNPKALIISETEIWPNLIRVMSSLIPVILINGRLSEKSFKNYKKLKFFIKPILNLFSAIGVQEKLYQHRFQALGVSPEKIILTGNIKFDLEIGDISFSWEKYLKQPIIIAGSTHFPEEKIILKAFLRVFSNRKQGTLLLVPRHPERFEEVEKMIKNLLSDCSEVSFLKVSEIEKDENFIERNRAYKLIILVDKVGILRYLYRICEIAIIGGSFIPHGGQNPLEAIYWKKTVIVGPHMENFPFIEEFLKKEAICQTSIEKLVETLEDLVQNENQRKELAKRAHQIFKEKGGAIEKTLKIIYQILGLHL
ncbi:MAG: 3-deoxy-D-manno-octulosonic acid transferase [Thermodesulfobacteriaceae bacterium]|nr:3-deoxy-D-manno-octulosonic acid transferase [Thermodesulfobacteriaceae bacterium]MDW8136130.1 3-deoxy-D-manno-octulosonic acid transferase [Thermodesulfobacterium sp.]